MAEPFARLRDARADYDGTPALHDITLDLPEGKVIAFCGPNGSGKSTALRLMRGLHRPAGGQVEIAGRPLADWTARELARAVAMLSQSPEAPPELSVADLVMLGRFAHRGRFAGPTAADRAACDRALAATEMAALRARPIGQLSGGQIQRAWIAMTLAQDAPRIFLDEPTNHLDVAHAFEVLDLILRLNRDEGRSFVLVLHDLNMAMRHADHVVLFAEGRIVAAGPTRGTLTERRVAEVFGVACQIVHLPGDETPVLVPLPKRGFAARAFASAAE
ncbi:MAG: ABC transporter ATP-binding protein [Burkholderiaceae bacterium]|nr:ABC transporter ATP-binding protein [Burkholderiaceae bacterium]